MGKKSTQILFLINPIYSICLVLATVNVLSKFLSFLVEENYIGIASPYKWIVNYSAQRAVVHHCSVQVNVANCQLFPNYIALYSLCPNQWWQSIKKKILPRCQRLVKQISLLLSGISQPGCVPQPFDETEKHLKDTAPIP